MAYFGLKKLGSFEDALKVDKNKEWKLKRMNHLGVDTLQRKVDVRSMNPMQGHLPKEVQHAIVVSMSPPVMPTIVVIASPNDGLWKEMKEVVDLMKNVSLNFLSNAGEKWVQKRHFNQPKSDHTQHKHNHGQSGGRGWQSTPTCYNCGGLGHIIPQCAKPPRMGGDMYPLLAQMPNKENDYDIQINGDTGPSGLAQDKKGT